jgi:predicted RNA-binding protein (virulence factor B family)
MATLGHINTLAALRETQSGFYLDGEELGEILLPGRLIPRGMKAGDTVEVFLYRDSEDRPVATTERPLACVGEFACMRVKDIHERAGAFLDWGLPKDLLLPFREQDPPVRVGQKVVVRVMLDQHTDRIIASALVSRHLSRERPGYRAGLEVDLLVFEETALGYNAIIEGTHKGLIYRSTVGAPLEIGARLRGFIKEVREDGKIDLSLDRAGYERVAPLARLILEELERVGGRLNLDDSSDPAEIRRRFGASKKAFKQAIGALYRERRIVLLNPGIELVRAGPRN